MALTKIDGSVLANTGVTSGNYGGSTQIPTLNIDGQGRIVSASNTALNTTINLAGTTGSGSVAGGGTLTFASNNGFVVSSTGASTLYFNSPQDIQTTASPQFTNLNLTGNLVVSGAYTYSNAAVFQTVDSLIALGANNTGDVVDIGFYGQYSTSSYAGLVRTGGSNFVLFKGLSAPTANSFGAVSLANYGTLRANITGGMVNALANTIGILDGGTNNSTYTTGALLQYNGSGIVSIANTGVTSGNYGGATQIPVLNIDAYGRVTSASNVSVTSGTTLTDDTTTATTHYPLLTVSTSGSISIANTSSSKLSYVPSTGTLTATAFSGSGASLTSLTAGNLSGTIPTGVLGNSTLYVGTTAIALNRASASQSLTGVSIDGSAGSATGSAATFTSTTQNSQFNSVGVGTAASATTGEIRATNNITAYYSDDRLKTKLGLITDALSKVKSLNGFYYEANETAQSLGYEVIREVGVSAQEVQSVMPEVVVPAPIDDKYLTVRYDKLIPLLVEAIKELSEEVERLKESK